MVSQLPTWLMSCPAKKRRKFRVCSDRKVSRRGPTERAHGSALSPERLDDVEGVGQAVELVGGQPGDASGEPGVLALTGPHDQLAAPGGGHHPHDAAVGGVGRPLDVAVGLEAGDHPGDGGRGHALVVGELAEGHGAVALDGDQGGELARRQPGVGVLAQGAVQSGHRQTQPGRDLLGLGGRGRRRRVAAGLFVLLVLPDRFAMVVSLAKDLSGHAPRVGDDDRAEEAQAASWVVRARASRPRCTAANAAARLRIWLRDRWSRKFRRTAST